MKGDSRRLRTRRIAWLGALFAALMMVGPGPLPATEPARNWTVYIAQDKHLDYNWCGTRSEIELRMTALLDYFIGQAEKRAGRWNLDSTLWADVYRRHRGAEGLARLRRAIRQGDMGYAGNHSVLLWGILDTETAIRACYGAADIERATGQLARTALIMENPGMTWGVANVLSECGFDFVGRGIYWLRAESYIRDRERYPLFWWRAPNGKRLLVRWDLYADTTSWGGYAEAFRLAEIAGVRPAAQRLQNVDDQNTPDVVRKRKAYVLQTVERYQAYGDAYPLSSILLLGTGHDGWICTDDISRFIAQFNAESDGRIRLVDARYQDFFQAALAEIKERKLILPTLEGSFGICWEEWAAHIAGLTRDFRQAQRLLRLAEAAHTAQLIVGEQDVPADAATPGIAQGNLQRQAELLRHGFNQLLLFAEHDMGGINRQLAATSAGVRADTVTQALDIGYSLAPRLRPARASTADMFRREDLTFSWNGGQVVFDGECCAVASLVDTNGRELVPPGRGPRFGEFIHTRYRTRAEKEAVFPQPIAVTSDLLLRQLECRRGPTGVEIRCKFERWGFEVTGTWLFHADRPWIDMTYRLEGGWTDDPQTTQLAFPLTLSQPSYRYDAPGAILIAGRREDGGDDLPGANPQLFAGLTFASATSGQRSVVLIAPDTLLLEFGPQAVRAPGYEGKEIPAQITSMPMMNLTGNDWQFGQAGQRTWTFRYRTVLADGAWDPVQAIQAVQQFATPPFLQVPEIAPAVPGLEALDVEFAGGPVLAFKIAEDRKRLMLRLWNVRGETCTGSLKLPPGCRRAEACDALERPKGVLDERRGRIRFSVGPRAILTIALCQASRPAAPSGTVR